MRLFSNLFISVRRSTCFRRGFRPSSGAQNCTYSVRQLSDHYCYLLLAWRCMCSFELLMTDGKPVWNMQSVVQKQINLRKVASRWLYSENILAMHGPMNVKLHIFLISAENRSGWSIHAPITLASKSNRTKRKSGQPLAKKPIHAPTKYKIPVVPNHPATLT